MPNAALLPGSNGYITIRQNTTAPDGLGRQTDGLRALSLPPYPQSPVLSCADEIYGEKHQSEVRVSQLPSFSRKVNDAGSINDQAPAVGYAHIISLPFSPFIGL